MHDLPAEWFSLCMVVLLLGMRHGLDADHLATIDGLTRLNQREGAPFARWCGTLFSLGHGAVVMTIAAVVGVMSSYWIPPWLDPVGSAVSIVFLLCLGLVNLRAVALAAPGHIVSPVGLKSRMLDFAGVRSPIAVAGVGALFALSFDTISQSALFAATAGRFGGLGSALTLGALFVIGMILTDGLNGWWISRLIRRSDRMAVVASRLLSATIACVSLIVAAVGIARWTLPAFDAWSDGRELTFGLAVITIIVVSYTAAFGIDRWRR